MKSVLIFACVTLFAGCSGFMCPNPMFPTLPCGRRVDDCTSDCGSQSGLNAMYFSGQQQYGQQAPNYPGLQTYSGLQQTYPVYTQQNAGYYSAVPQGFPESTNAFAFGNLQAAQGYTAGQAYPSIQTYPSIQNYPSFQTGAVYPAYQPTVGDLRSNAGLQLYPGLVSQPSKTQGTTNVSGASNKK